MWFGTGPEVAALRLITFLSIFDCFDYFELYGKIEDSLLVAVCLLTYIVLQVKSKMYFIFFFSIQKREKGVGVLASESQICLDVGIPCNTVAYGQQS